MSAVFGFVQPLAVRKRVDKGFEFFQQGGFQFFQILLVITFKPCQEYSVCEIITIGDLRGI